MTLRERELEAELAALHVKWAQALAERDKARALVVSHHAVGVLDDALIGDDCPVCAAVKETACA